NYTCISENLIQIFNNIIFNSIQSMYESTEKKLSVRVEKIKEIPIEYKGWKSSNENFEFVVQGKSTHGFVLIEFIDTGIGISLENQDKIFTSFFTTKKLGEGIGLGLYVSKKITNEMGGAIFFQSREGVTNFSIFLPFQD
ncbi:MAG: ATP-binding protein, partial [Spirochaetia bacterium]|nr:ATP-binding protein [Spirochaetia bacterium]